MTKVVFLKIAEKVYELFQREYITKEEKSTYLCLLKKECLSELSQIMELKAMCYTNMPLFNEILELAKETKQ